MADLAQLTDEGPAPPEVVLVTGFPSFTALRMARKVLAADGEARVLLLARDGLAADAAARLAALPDAEGRRGRVVVGDAGDMDLGLAGGEVKELCAEVTTVHHLAASSVEATRGVIDFAGECRRLRRLCHWSSAAVSGRRRGVILEEELDEGQGFHNAHEETRFEAEKLARAAARRLPVTIFRPGIIVGDSRTGEIDVLDGPDLVTEILAQRAAGAAAAPLQLAPIDFVVDAAYALSRDARAAGGTFHLLDPCPLGARHIRERIAERAGRKRPRGLSPTALARAVVRGLVDPFVYYNPRHALALLEGTGIRCPPFESYVDALVRPAREARARVEDQVFDPFE